MELTPVQRAIVSSGAPLFAVLDAARHPSIFRRLRDAAAWHACLYTGKDAKTLARYAPYLVAVNEDDALLQDLLKAGWGKSWGIYITARVSPDDLLAHLRTLVFAQLPDERKVYFRFYDPRVLRVFVPTCTAEQAAEIIGPCEAIYCEGEDPYSGWGLHQGKAQLEPLIQNTLPPHPISPPHLSTTFDQ